MLSRESAREVAAWVEGHRDEGIHCPGCGQLAKVYHRRINSGMARSLIAMYRKAGTDFLHLPTAISARSREEGRLRWWGLVEEATEPRPDGGRAGWWRVTDKGASFIKGHVAVRERALIYDNTLLGLEGPWVTIHDALGNKFNLNDLMKGEI